VEAMPTDEITLLSYLKWAPSDGRSRRCGSCRGRGPPRAGTRRCPSCRNCMSRTWSCTCKQTACHAGFQNVRYQLHDCRQGFCQPSQHRAVSVVSWQHVQFSRWQQVFHQDTASILDVLLLLRWRQRGPPKRRTGL